MFGVSTKTGVRDGSVLLDQRWLQWVNKLLPRLKTGNSKEKISKVDHPAAATMFKTATDALGLSGITMYQTRLTRTARVRGFRTLQEVRKRGRWKAFSSVTRYVKNSRLVAEYHSLLRPLRNKLETFARRSKGLLIQRLQNPTAHSRMTGTCMIDVFGVDLASCQERRNLRGSVLFMKFGPRYHVTKPFVCPHQNPTGRLRW